jgi:hypothetical protein
MVYGLLRALPGDRAFLSPSLPDLYSTNLMPASRHQDHTTSPSASSALVSSTARVHRIPLHVDDVGQRPSVGQDGQLVELICPTGKAEYFCEQDWTGRIALIGLSNLAFTRIDFWVSQPAARTTALPLPLAGEGWGGGAAAYSLRPSPRRDFPHPPRSSSAATLGSSPRAGSPRKRER